MRPLMGMVTEIIGSTSVIALESGRIFRAEQKFALWDKVIVQYDFIKGAIVAQKIGFKPEEMEVKDSPEPEEIEHEEEYENLIDVLDSEF